MAKLFKGKLPSDQREMTLIDINGETIRSWHCGLDRRQAMRTVQQHTRRVSGDAYTVRNVICAEGGRGDVVRELRVLTDGMTYAGGDVPTDYR